MIKKINQSSLILKYFENHPNRSIPHKEVVDWAVVQYKELTGDVLRDPDRAIRKLHQEGKLKKIEKGVYLFDPNYRHHSTTSDFSEKTKKEIFERDHFRCVLCGKGADNGAEIHADHVKPRDKGGESTLQNGQTLCSQHNFQKKNYDMYEFGRRMFQTLLDKSQANGDTSTVEFCLKILSIYDEFNFV